MITILENKTTKPFIVIYHEFNDFRLKFIEFNNSMDKLYGKDKKIECDCEFLILITFLIKFLITFLNLSIGSISTTDRLILIKP